MDAAARRSRPSAGSGATSVHCDSLTVWPTRSWSTRVGRLLGRIWPRTTSSGSCSAASVGPGSDGGTGTSRRRSEKERSDSTPHYPSRRWRCSSSSGSRSVWLGASSAGVGITARPLAVAPAAAGGHRHRVRRAGPGSPQRRRRPTAASTARRSSARSATWSSRWASEAVVRGTPRATKRSSSRWRRVLLAHRLAPAGRGELGRHARRRRRLGDAVPPLGRRVGDVAGHLDQVGVGEHVARARGGQLLDGRRCRRPSRRRPRAPTTRAIETGSSRSSKRHAADPVHRAEQDVEGVAGEQAGHLVHAALGSSRPRARCTTGQPGLLGLQRALDVGVEVGRGVERPSSRAMDAASAGGTARRPRSRRSSASAWRKRKRCSVSASSVTPAAWARSQ